jgi:hypothetical protein
MNYLRRLEGQKKVRRLLRIYRARAASRIAPNWQEMYADGGELERQLLKNRVRCSGPCCGNQRRHFGQLTVQERRYAPIATSDAHDDAVYAKLKLERIIEIDEDDYEFHKWLRNAFGASLAAGDIAQRGGDGAVDASDSALSSQTDRQP